MILLFGRAARSLIAQLTAEVFLLLILAVPVRVKAQCLECTSQSIKLVNATGHCTDCYPCPRCPDGHTSSVPCGTNGTVTVSVGTDIKCVLIQSSTQTSNLLSTSLIVAPSSKELVVASVTSIHPVVVSATSSSPSASSSIRGREISAGTTKKPKSEKALLLKEWKKNTNIYIFGGIFLVITLVAIVCRILKRKSTKRLQLRPVSLDGLPISPPQPTSGIPTQDRETCNINLATNTVGFTRQKDHTSETRDWSERSQPGELCNPLYEDEHHSKLPDLPSHPVETNRDSEILNYAPAIINTPSVYMVVQSNAKLVLPGSWPQSLTDIVSSGPTTNGLEQGQNVSWSDLSQSEKYNKKVLEMPFPLLYKTCLTLDIQRADGNDVRMLAYQLGLSVGELDLLKQAAITQNPDNHNPLSYIVLKEKFLDEKPSGTVRDFVDILKEIGRDDIVSLIINWP